MDYYDNRDEFEYVGFIDKELSRRKTKTIEELKDTFKLREKRPKIMEKKRATGLPSLSGAVCSTSKSKNYLNKVLNKLNINVPFKTRTNVCDTIQEKMLFLEKYSTKKDGNKMTYVMIPLNHPIYPFPYNLEDRVEYISEKINHEIGKNIDIKVSKDKQSSGTNKGLPIYTIHIPINDKTTKHEQLLKSLNATKKDKEWIITCE